MEKRVFFFLVLSVVLVMTASISSVPLAMSTRAVFFSAVDMGCCVVLCC